MSLQHLRSSDSGGQLSENLLFKTRDSYHHGGGGDADFSVGGRDTLDSSRRSPPQQKVTTMVHKNQLKTLNGVVVPCMLNIMGIVLFLRLGWGIGQVGVVGTFLFFLVGELASIMTVFSFSAIITNGKMEGGGSYFMLSRAMGPEFGGSIGILFYAAYAVGCTFYIVGFSTEVTGTFLADDANNFAINLAIGSAALFIVTVVAYGGAEAFTKINIWLFVGQFGSLVCSLAAMIGLSFSTSWPMCRMNTTLSNGTQDLDFFLPLDHNGTFHPWKLERFFNNSMWSLESGAVELCNMGPCTFQLVFSVLYPSVSGIMEGANLSGDLKNPSKSIPKGTLIAIFASFFFYAMIIIVLAGCFDHETLLENTMVMQDILHWPGHKSLDGQYVIIAGVFISTLSSALGALFGGSRVLQAIAKDKLFPCLTFFAKGSVKGDEPRRAVILTWFIAQLCLFMGDLNTIAPVLSCFFCLSYAAVNFACFILDISGAPNFRPTWKWFSWHLSLFGAFLNLGIMFYLNGVYGVIACGLLMLLFLLLTWTAPVVEWGDVSQALIFHQVRKYLLMLTNKKQHRKYWRPSILLISNEVNPLIEFCANLKKGGLFVLGTVIKGDFAELNATAQKVRQAWQKIILQAKIKAFSQIVIAPTTRIGYSSLVTCHGLGAMNANTVVIPFFDPDTITSSIPNSENLRKAWEEHAVRLQRWPWSPPSMTPLPPMFDTVQEFVGVVQDVLTARKNLLITRNFHKLRIITRQLGGQRRTTQQANVSLEEIGAYTLFEGQNRELHDVVSSECETEVESSQGTIDVWIVGSWAVEDLSRTLSLLLQLAHIIHEKKEWKKQTHLRLLQVIDPISPLDSVNKDKPFQCGAGTAASRKHNLTQEKINNTDTQLNEDEESDIKSQRMKDAGHENFAFAVGQNVRILLKSKSQSSKIESVVAQVVRVVRNDCMYLKLHGRDDIITFPEDCEGPVMQLSSREEIKYCENLLTKLAQSVRIDVKEVRAFHLQQSSEGHNFTDMWSDGSSSKHLNFYRQQSEEIDSKKVSGVTSIFVRVNRLIKFHSRNAVAVFFPLPPLPQDANKTSNQVQSPSTAVSRSIHKTAGPADVYMRNLKDLTQDLPPVVLVRMGKFGEGVISTEM